MRVFASIPELTVAGKGAERNKEAYVVCIASDLSGETSRPLTLGAKHE